MDLPDKDYIARLCKRKFVIDGVPGEGAFLLRKGHDGVPPETELSVYWLDLLDQHGSNGAAQVAALRGFLKHSPYREMERKDKDRFARLRVNQIHGELLAVVPTKQLRTKHVPRGTEADPHSEIFGLDHGPESLKIAALLAEWSEPYAAV